MTIKKLKESVERLIEFYDEISEDSVIPAYDDEVKEDQPSKKELVIKALKDGDFDSSELDEIDNLAEYVVPELDKFSKQELVRILEKGDKHNSLFPSGWNAEKFGPYPKALAEALVESRDRESITDLYNIFYADRQISKDAIEVLKKDALKFDNNTLIVLSNILDADSINPILDAFSEAWPNFFNQFIKGLIKEGFYKHK